MFLAVPPLRGLTRLALPALCLGLALLLVYLPGLHGPFLFDDFPNLVQSRAIRAYADGSGSLWSALREAHAGPAGRPLAVLTLAVQARVSGLLPYPFKLFNLLLHFCNALLVRALVLALLRRVTVTVLPTSTAPVHQALPRRPEAALAWLTAALWALHPLALTPVLLVVQRMTSLATLGSLLALYAAVQAHGRLAAARPVGPWLWCAYPLAGLAAVLAKESALLLPIYLLAINLTLLRTVPLAPLQARQWRRFMLLAAWLPLLLAVLALPWAIPHWLQGFHQREFTAAERLLTEARVLWFYLRLLLVPDPAELGLFHDDFAWSTDWSSPWTTLPALLGLAALASVVAVWRRRAPWPAFAVAFLLASQLLESTLVPLELVFEHRMYLGMLGPILLAVLASWEWLARNRVAAPLAWVGLVIVLAGFTTWQRAADWGDALLFASVEARHHPGSVRAQYELANVYGNLGEFEQQPEARRRQLALAEQAALHAIAVAPQDAKPRVGLILICVMAGCTPPSDNAARLMAILRTDHRTELLASDLASLAQCAAQGKCPLELGQWRALCDALAANPELTAHGAAMVADAHRWLDLAQRRAPAAGAATP